MKKEPTEAEVMLMEDYGITLDEARRGFIPEAMERYAKKKTEQLQIIINIMQKDEQDGIYTCSKCDDKKLLEVTNLDGDVTIRKCPFCIDNPQEPTFEHCSMCHKPLHDGDGRTECRDCIDTNVPESYEDCRTYLEDEGFDVDAVIADGLKELETIKLKIECNELREENRLYRQMNADLMTSKIINNSAIKDAAWKVVRAYWMQPASKPRLFNAIDELETTLKKEDELF